MKQTRSCPQTDIVLTTPRIFLLCTLEMSREYLLIGLEPTWLCLFYKSMCVWEDKSPLASPSRSLVFIHTHHTKYTERICILWVHTQVCSTRTYKANRLHEYSLLIKRITKRYDDHAFLQIEDKHVKIWSKCVNVCM